MNELEKLYALLNRNGRVIKYGELVAETDDPLIALRTGECTPAASYLTDAKNVENKSVVVCVYASDYMAGYDLSEQIKADVKAAVKDSVVIMHGKDAESVYEQTKGRYVFKSVYKILKN